MACKTNCDVEINSTSLTVAYPPILGDLASRLSTLRNIACPIFNIATHLPGSSTVIPCMHTSQRVKGCHKNTGSLAWDDSGFFSILGLALGSR